MFRPEIVGEAEEQGAVFGTYRFAFDNPADRAAAHFPLLAAVGIGDLAFLEKQLPADQFDVVEAIVLATLLDHFRDQVEDEGRMDSEASAVADASVQKYAFF